MRRLMGALLALVAAAVMTGCVTQGKDFSSDLSWIKVNETTQSDVSSLLGTPHQVGNVGGTPTWTYSYYKLKMFGDSHTKDLKFYWTPDKKVKDFSFSSSFPTDKRQSLYMNKKGTAPEPKEQAPF